MSTQTKSVISWVVTFIVMLIITTPGLWVILSGFRPLQEILAKPAIWIPQRLTLENFYAIFGIGETQIAIPVLAYFRNSIIIASTSTAIAIIVGISGGYAFARYRFKFKDTLFLGLMLSRTVPGIALSLPVFIVWARLVGSTRNLA